MDTTRTRSRWLTPRFFLWSLLFWTGFGLVQMALPMALSYWEASSQSRLRNFLWGVSMLIVPYALLTPPVFAVVERLTRRRAKGLGYVALLGVLLVFVALLRSTVWIVMFYARDLVTIRDYVVTTFTGELLRSGAIVATAVAVVHYQLAQRRRQESLQAQLRALRSQLQPHFLFNTLQAIGATARTDGALAARLIALLGDLLRQSLRDRDQPEVTLQEELDLLQPYLELQRLRFGDRLTIDVDVPDDLLCARVPDLLLQPLVENALQHGIEARPGAGRIVIGARRVGRDLALSVRDDGAGDGPLGDDGIGLGTTRSRLQGLYGGRAQLTVERAVGGGALATVQLPFGTIADAA